MFPVVLAYADQNFLSRCSQDSELQTRLLALNDTEKVKLVLSPWHFYELGNASSKVREDIITFIEAVRPRWIHDRWTLQRIELLSAWNSVYYSSKPGDYVTVSYGDAFTLRAGMQLRMSLREIVAEYQSPEGRATLEEMFVEQEKIAADTTVSYRAGLFTARLIHSVVKTHIASQFAKAEGLLLKKDLLRRSAELLKDPLLDTMVDVFLFWGGERCLKAWQAEAFFATHLQRTGAKLSTNNNVDRQHAIVAMPYCDVFVTDDKKLAKRCRELSARLSGATARVMTCSEFITEFVGT